MLWIRIRIDPHSFGCPGSGSVFECGSGSRSIKIDQNLQNKPSFLPFKKAQEYLLDKSSTFGDLKFDHDLYAHGSALVVSPDPDPDPH
jgi:hypothetical protein